MDEITLTPADLATGCLPQPPDTRVGVAVGYTGTLVPESQWASADALKRFVPRGKCQGSVPACNWYTTGKAYQTKYAYMSGGKCPQVSYCAGYQEDTGGNFRVGTMPLDSIKAIAARGLHPVTPDCPEWFNSPRRIPAAVEAARPLYRADEWEELRTKAEIVSAILNNDPVNAGMDWYDSDANPGPTGHLPVRGSGRPGGHSVLFCGVVTGYAPSPSGVGLLFNNHHGDSQTPATKDERGRTLRFPVWGDDGFGVVPVERVEADARKYGAWALRTVYVRNEDLADVPTPKFGDLA